MLGSSGIRARVMGLRSGRWSPAEQMGLWRPPRQSERGDSREGTLLSLETVSSGDRLPGTTDGDVAAEARGAWVRAAQGSGSLWPLTEALSAEPGASQVLLPVTRASPGFLLPVFAQGVEHRLGSRKNLVTMSVCSHRDLKKGFPGGASELGHLGAKHVLSAVPILAVPTGGQWGAESVGGGRGKGGALRTSLTFLSCCFDLWLQLCGAEPTPSPGLSLPWGVPRSSSIPQ